VELFKKYWTGLVGSRSYYPNGIGNVPSRSRPILDMAYCTLEEILVVRSDVNM
jgi:hypothetical protein